MDIILLADGDAGGELVRGYFSLFFFVVTLGIITSLFWLWMLLDVLTSQMETNEKILWFLVVLFLHFVGAFIYFVVRHGRTSVTA